MGECGCDLDVWRCKTHEDDVVLVLEDGEPSTAMVERAARQMQDECGPFFEKTPHAGLFDWRVAARNALSAALAGNEER